MNKLANEDDYQKLCKKLEKPILKHLRFAKPIQIPTTVFTIKNR